MSRVDSSFLAVHKARQQGHDPSGAVLASDAFFPFRDGWTRAAAAGVTAIIQPGGSVKDAEVIAAADERPGHGPDRYAAVPSLDLHGPMTPAKQDLSDGGRRFTRALILYTITLAPTTQFWDASEYIAAATRSASRIPPRQSVLRDCRARLGPAAAAADYARRINLLAALTSAVSAGTVVPDR